MTKITVETINGKKFTRILHTERDFNVGKQMMFWGGYEAVWQGEHYATYLPALPRHPKPEHAPLLYRYMAEGIIPYGKMLDPFGRGDESLDNCDGNMMARILHDVREITHATYNGEIVSIAIEDEGEAR